MKNRKGGAQTLSRRERARRARLSEKVPNGGWRFTHRDTPKGVARTDNKTGKKTYLYLK